MTADNFDKEIQRILQYPQKVSKRVVKENKLDILDCLKYYNAFDDWGHILPFIHRASENKDLRTWEVFLEADINMETALIQSIHGLYKSSLMSLRSCLETTFLTVFYSYPENDREYDDFWKGKIDAPRFGQVRNFLFSMKGLQAFDTNNGFTRTSRRNIESCHHSFTLVAMKDSRAILERRERNP